MTFLLVLDYCFDFLGSFDDQKVKYAGIFCSICNIYVGPIVINYEMSFSLNLDLRQDGTEELKNLTDLNGPIDAAINRDALDDFIFE